ncbi:chromatin associated protein KTI12 [Schizopora paradoxa]|uniref:Chromatin associated protein KTI12 n=1 Tax=Schizopora paradoxa TaxID=27342 RepID=A0A0H2SEZ6_9AGAM|nr:chromatin associated protein KTI12 [Schizopora paradoxa]
MALVTISGYPASGKTRRALQLKSYLEERLQSPEYTGPTLKVVIVSDADTKVKRSVYDDGRQEKPARAALFTAVQRLINKDTILIVDGMNYIKGYRYQLYCAAREQQIRVCTIFVVAKPEHCREWNTSRAEGEEADTYSSSTLDNLIARYEEPNSMVRWDSPLFTIPWIEEDIPGPDIFNAITSGIVKPPNVGTSTVAPTPTDALHNLEQTSTQVVSAIMSAQSTSPSSGFGGPLQISVELPSSVTINKTITLPARTVTISQLQRLKRQFVTTHKKVITLGASEKGAVDWSPEIVAEKLVRFIEEYIGS